MDLDASTMDRSCVTLASSTYDVKIMLDSSLVKHKKKIKNFGFYLTAGRAFKMRKTGERGCYGNTCCTILFLVVWAFYMVVLRIRRL